jgi:hypothetical protein
MRNLGKVKPSILKELREEYIFSYMPEYDEAEDEYDFYDYVPDEVSWKSDKKWECPKWTYVRRRRNCIVRMEEGRPLETKVDMESFRPPGWFIKKKIQEYYDHLKTIYT